MPAAVPLRYRIPLEYAVTMGFSAAIAWLYARYAEADFLLALSLGLAMVLGFWLVMQIYPRTRSKGTHMLTAAALAVTLFVVLRLAGAA